MAIGPFEAEDFLAKVQVDGSNGGGGLGVVLKKKLEGFINFSGYDAIRQNVIALTRLSGSTDVHASNIQLNGRSCWRWVVRAMVC